MIRPDGADDLRSEIAMTWDPGDPYGSVMTWWFAIAETLQRHEPWTVPAAWDYSPGAFGPPDPESFEDTSTEAIYEDHGGAALVYWGDVLQRMAHWCDLAGFSY